MTKQEFLERLKAALNGKIVPEQVEENIRFYEDYINTEVRKGKSEEEVLASLGDPRLIARTITETMGTEETVYRSQRSEYGQREQDEYRGQEQNTPVQKVNFALVPAWVWLVLGILVVVLILSVVFSVVSALLPVVLPILFVLLLVKVFRDWVN